MSMVLPFATRNDHSAPARFVSVGGAAARCLRPRSRRDTLDSRLLARENREVSMILTHDEILKEIEAGRIGIDPYDPDSVGPASIDLRLGTEIRIFSPMPTVMPITTGSDYRDITYKLELAESGYIIKPNELVLGITLERIHPPARHRRLAQFALALRATRAHGPHLGSIHAARHIQPAGSGNTQHRSELPETHPQRADMPVRVRAVRGRGRLRGAVLYAAPGEMVAGCPPCRVAQPPVSCPAPPS